MIGVQVFVGVGDKWDEAAAAVEEQATGWLARHQWRTPDGLSSYTVASSMYTKPRYDLRGAHVGELCVVALSFTGPIEETQP